MGIIVNDQELDGPEALIVKNYKNDPSVYRFKNRRRPTAEVNAVVVHETVTRSWSDTVSVLKQRGLGVHFIADADGTMYQHADLWTDDMWHASQFNELSVGIETVNPYEPQFLSSHDSPWEHTINAPWAAGGKYVVPTPAQAEAVCQLINWLTSADANPIAIPQHWPGFQGAKKLAMGRVSADVKENPGIHAHMYFGHADGAWLVFYCWLRLEPGLEPEAAYEEAIKRATGAGSAGIDLTDYFDSNPYLST